MRSILFNSAIPKRLCQSKVRYEGVKINWKQPNGHETGFSVYNNLAKREAPLVTERQNLVKWYSCGPTVYDHSHIGHAFCYVRFDLIRRILESRGFSIVYALNITDIDDKIIARSSELKRSCQDVAQEFEKSFFDDLNSLNVLPPSITLRVTENVPRIVEFVQRLLTSGFAYQTPSGVYFDTAKDEGYPRFQYNRPMEGAKLNEKRNHSDFALWKAAKPGEPWWESPFGKGRPGWHIECSAMASRVFGDSIDIHTGGKDLQFPHHENEEAQSCAYHSCSNWAKYYLHSGHVHFGNEKMSKSLGNVITIKDLLKESSPDEFRMMCLRFPYRSDLDFNPELKSSAKSSLERINTVLKDCNDYLEGRFLADLNEEQLLQNLFLTQLKVNETLLDDFNFSEATLAVLNLVHSLGTQLDTTDKRVASALVAVAATKKYIENFFLTMGLQLSSSTAAGNEDLTRKILDHSTDFRFSVRKSALNIKSTPEGKELLQECDKFRSNLKSTGVTIKDKGDRSVWTLS